MKKKIVAIPLPPRNPLDLIRPEHIEQYTWSGVCLRVYRISGNINRKELASRLHINRSTLDKYEDGRKRLGIKVAKALGDIFHVDWRVFRRPPKVDKRIEKVDNREIGS